MAGFYLHPGAPVETDGFATTRCYFDRASAPVTDPEGKLHGWLTLKPFDLFSHICSSIY